MLQAAAARRRRAAGGGCSRPRRRPARAPARLQVQRVGAEGRAAAHRDRRAATSRPERSPSRAATPARSSRSRSLARLPRSTSCSSDVQASLFSTARDEQERRTLRDPRRLRRDDRVPPRGRAGSSRRRGAAGSECEARVKDDSSATIRCLPLGEQPTQAGACVCCGQVGDDHCGVGAGVLAPREPRTRLVRAGFSSRLLNRETERAGFEPAMDLSAHTRFPVALLRPLGHLSGPQQGIRAQDSLRRGIGARRGRPDVGTISRFGGPQPEVR